MSENKSLLSQIVTWVIIGVVAVVALKLALRLLGFVMGLAGAVLGIAVFLMFTVGPILLVGWLGMKAYRGFSRPTA